MSKHHCLQYIDRSIVDSLCETQISLFLQNIAGTFSLKNFKTKIFKNHGMDIASRNFCAGEVVLSKSFLETTGQIRPVARLEKELII